MYQFRLVIFCAGSKIMSSEKSFLSKSYILKTMEGGPQLPHALDTGVRNRVFFHFHSSNGWAATLFRISLNCTML
jgi:hypothetical protein